MMYHHHGLQTTFTGEGWPPCAQPAAALFLQNLLLPPQPLCLPHRLTCCCTHLAPSLPSPGNYDEYFGMATDVEAVVYLMLVNSEWLHHEMFSFSFAVLLQQARRQSVALRLLRALDHVSGGPHSKLPMCLVDC